MADNHEENVKVENGNVAAGEIPAQPHRPVGLSKVRTTSMWNSSKSK